MRVAIITESFAPDVNGVANSVVRIAEHLVRRGHSPLVIAPEPASRRYASTEAYPVLRLPSLPMPGYRNVRLALPSKQIKAALLFDQAPPSRVAAAGILISTGVALLAFSPALALAAATFSPVNLGSVRGS